MKTESKMWIVSKKEAQQYRDNLRQFEERQAEDRDLFSDSTEKTYFVISTSFLNTWRQFCLSSSPQRPPLPVINADLFTQNNELLSTLQEKENYQIISKKAYDTFYKYNKIDIQRRAIMVGKEKRVFLKTQTYNYCLIKKQTLKQIDSNMLNLSQLVLHSVQFSQMGSVSEMLQYLLQKTIRGSQSLRAWKVTESRQVLFQYLKKAANRADTTYRIKGFGKKIPNEAKLMDLGMQQTDFLVLQAKDYYQRWFLQGENEDKCDGCFEYLELPIQCECEKVRYCNESCRIKDKRFHMRICEFAEMAELNKPIDMSITPYSKKGIVGLRNLGNTCFMNSCLQCLSNTKILTDYFLRGYFQAEINKKNPLGQKGRLAKSYAHFIRAMWCGQQSVANPQNLKNSVSIIAPMFAGYAQHDSQEFFSFLVDGLHEDLNRIEVKPYVEKEQCLDEAKAARLSWIAHIKRNQSIIVDTMTGQYRSLVKCPDCPKRSITYDPFITVTLPLPNKIKSSVDCLIIYPNLQQKIKKIKISYKKLNPDQWLNAASKEIEMPVERIKIYLLSVYECIYLVGRDPLKNILYKVQEQKKRLYTFILTPEELKYKELIELPCLFGKKAYYGNHIDNLWVKFPLFLDLSVATGKSIIQKLLTFLYSQVYDNSKKRATFFDGDSLQGYLSKMMENKPFTLVLKYDRKVGAVHHRIQTQFMEFLTIEDTTRLKDVFNRIKEEPHTCELNVLLKDSSSVFNFDRLRIIEDDYGSKSYGQHESVVDLEDCFTTLREEEELQEGNEWYCPDCKDHKKAIKTMSIHKAPSILILHLKRFKQKGAFRKEKNQSKVIFPLKLNMNKYVNDPKAISDYEQEAKELGVYVKPKYEKTQMEIQKNNSNAVYELYAVSNHFGGMGGGHYTAYAKNSNSRWYEFNDSSVHEMREDQVCTSAAYMLFYQRM